MKIEKLPNKLLPFLWLFLKKYKFTFIAYAIISVIVIDLAFMFLQPYLLNVFFDKITNNTINIVNGLFLILCISFSDTWLFFETISNTLKFNSITKTIEDIRDEIFRYLIKQSANFFGSNYSGEIVSKINAITNCLESSVSAIFDTMKNLFLLFVSCIVVSIFSKILALAILVWFILYCFVCYCLIIKKSATQSKLVQENQNKITAFITDDFVNIQNIKAFSTQKMEENKLIKLLVKKFRKIYLEIKYQRISDILFFILNFSIYAFVIIFAILQLKNGSMVLGSFVFLLDLLRKITFASGNIRWCISAFKDAIVMTDSLDLITADIEIKDKEDAKDLELTGGRISFKNITFGYRK